MVINAGVTVEVIGSKVSGLNPDEKTVALMLQVCCVAVCCSVLQCVCCSVL